MEQNNEVNPQELRNMEVLQQQDPGEHGQQEVGDVQQPPRPPPMPCPRCDSPETKFCYFNNHKADQPRFYCKTCRRHWTRGGTLRNIPIGGTSRKLKKSSKRASPCVNPVTMPCSPEDTIVSSPESPLKTEELGNISTSPVPVIAHGGATQIPRFSSRSSAHDTQKRHRLNNIMSSDFTISGGSINLPPSRLKQYHQLQWYQQQQQLAHISVSGSLSSVREIQKLNHFANLRGSDFIHSGILNFPPSGLQHHHQVQRHQRAQPQQQQEHFSGSGLLSSVAEIQKPTHLSDMINSDFILSSGLNPPPSNMQDQLQQPQHQKQSQQHPAPSHNPSCGLLSSVPEIQHLNNLDNMIGYAFTLSGGPSLPPSGMQHHYHKQRWHQQYQDQNQRQPTHNTHSGSLSFVPEVQKLNNLSGGLNLPPFAVRNDNSNVVSQWLPVEQSQYRNSLEQNQFCPQLCSTDSLGLQQGFKGNNGLGTEAVGWRSDNNTDINPYPDSAF